MTHGEQLALELEVEAAGTRKLLERLPDDKFGWQPHEKSMTLGRLAAHLAEMAIWTVPTVELDVFDPGDFTPWQSDSRADMLRKHDGTIAQAAACLRKANDGIWQQTWTFKTDGKTIFSMPRAAVMRTLILNHLIHHRGQLTVYLRLLNVPLPAIYGPSADEQN